MRGRRALVIVIGLTLLAASTEAIRQQQCPRRDLLAELSRIDLASRKFSTWTYPTSNRLYQSNSSWWKISKDGDAVSHSSQAIPSYIKAVVFFYYSPSCPYSKALRPLVECLPKFFPPSVVFFAVDVRTLPGNLVLTNGVVATPRIRLLHKDSMVSYKTTECDLESLIDFVETHAEVDAVSSMDSLGSCKSSPHCACTIQVAPVTAADIAQLGNNRWMLLSCIFLVAICARTFVQY